jgi:hypothetical protein
MMPRQGLQEVEQERSKLSLFDKFREQRGYQA